MFKNFDLGLCNLSISSLSSDLILFGLVFLADLGLSLDDDFATLSLRFRQLRTRALLLERADLLDLMDLVDLADLADLWL